MDLKLASEESLTLRPDVIDTDVFAEVQVDQIWNIFDEAKLQAIGMLISELEKLQIQFMNGRQKEISFDVPIFRETNRAQMWFDENASLKERPSKHELKFYYERTKFLFKIGLKLVLYSGGLLQDSLNAPYDVLFGLKCGYR